MKSPDLKLVIGDKSLSSWSMRAWLALKASGLPFEEIPIKLDQPETKEKLTQFSPSQKVPCLIHGDLRIWDSLAICEYVAELAPGKNLWPSDPQKRALARAYVCEMHSGFQALRSQLSMDLHLRIKVRHLLPETIQDIRRIVSLWESALDSHDGPFLFGSFGIVDAFYAPVVFRFLSYGVRLNSKPATQYMLTMQQAPAVKSWLEGALNEEPEAVIIG